MRRLLVLFSVLLSYGSCTCSDGYQDMGNGFCYRSFVETTSQREAEAFCEENGGDLVQPTNLFVNAFVLSEEVTTNIWLGLTCLGTSKTSCTFSSGNEVTPKTFTNFYPGHPNSSIGNCVYISAQNGNWFSDDCDAQSIAFGCQRNISADPPNYVVPCGSSYEENGNFCYKILASTTEENAEFACELECGHLTTIHSEEENTFIQNMAYTSGESHSRIGLVWTINEEFVWTDGSKLDGTDFNNFGYMEPSLGNCVAMSLEENIVKRGQWINSPCSRKTVSVCKRPRVKPCVPSTVVPTLAPPTCSATYFFQGNGTIYSPDYPSSYSSGLDCEYVITAPSGSIVYFALTSEEVFSDYRNSNISLYSNVMDSTPFLASLEFGLDYHYTVYASTSPTMRVKFSSGSSAQHRWNASYHSLDIRPSGCNQGILKTPGTITTPNWQGIYNGVYPSLYNCTYQLQASSGERISLHLEYFNSLDLVLIYDGPDSDSPLLQNYTGYYRNGLPAVTSTSNNMVVTLLSDEGRAYQGFIASFTAA